MNAVLETLAIVLVVLFVWVRIEPTRFGAVISWTVAYGTIVAVAVVVSLALFALFWFTIGYGSWGAAAAR